MSHHRVNRSCPNVSPLGFAVACAFYRIISRALIDSRGNRTHAARQLRLSRPYLVRVLRTLSDP